MFGVEVLGGGDEVYFSGGSVRTHGSCLVTLRTQRLSEFELHARAAVGQNDALQRGSYPDRKSGVSGKSV